MVEQNIKTYKLFKYGSTWLKADFHLHTKADKEFLYSGEDDQYINKYVAALKNADINIGIITNHNKFDYEEFKTLRKRALKEEIYLLPGVELSVNDGANGIHTLVIFSDFWIENGNDYINQFLNVTFQGKTPSEYENKNGRSNDSLIETIKKLEGYSRDFFLVFAHIEQKNGLWNELDGGRLQELGSDKLFRRRTLGFQKVRTYDVADKKCRTKVKTWPGNFYPAEVEGSDCKSIDQIGVVEPCYLKIGDFSFEAIKYAILDYEHRISKELSNYTHSHICEIYFEGGVLDGKTVHFSPELNSLIGIRGSGKSSILEAVRYVLDIAFGENAMDKDYKKRLVNHALGSGGKAIVRAVDKQGRKHEIRRILYEQPDVYDENTKLIPGVSIRETVLHKPIYFGQKDLSSTGEGFEKDLVEKLVGEKLIEIRSKIEIQRQQVTETILRLQKLSNVEEKKKEYEDKKLDAEHRLKIFKEHGVEEKLQKQVDFEVDERKCKQINSFLKEYLNDLDELINRYDDDLKNHCLYKSKQNSEFFTGFFEIYQKITGSFNLIKQALVDGKSGLAELTDQETEFAQNKQNLKEEFADIERRLSAELKDSGVQAISLNDFLNQKKLIDKAKQMLNALEKQQLQLITVKNDLISELSKLNDLWHEEFKIMRDELNKVNENNSYLQVSVLFKGDKSAFKDYLKDLFRGSKIRDNTFIKLTDKFSDFGAIYKNFEKIKEIVGGSASVFDEYFTNNMSAFLTWQVPNSFVIKYREKELKDHSLGQRASALILFVLSQRENDVIIIDQPEDDLDNQTIYEDVIKLIRKLKFKTQFIFATHNANFPVLGDSEQVIACSYSDEKVSIISGSIDCRKLQQEIVSIMEGGDEAFDRRKEIYQIWKSQNS